VFHRPVDFLERHRIPRGVGIILCYLLLFGIITLVLVVIGPVLRDQIVDFLNAIPGYVRQLTDWVTSLWSQYGYLMDNSDIRSVVDSLGKSATSWASSAASTFGNGVIASVTSIVTSIAVSFMAMVAAFWFLLDYHRIADEFHTVVGPEKLPDVSAVFGIFSRCIGGYCKGLLLASCCTGLIAGIGFAIIGEPYAVALGFLTGLMNIIPVIGPWVAGLIAALIGLSVDPWVCLLSIVITVCAQQFTDTFITPKIMSSTVELHPGLVVVALAAGASIGGVLGMILAVPLTGAAKSIYAYFFEKRTGRRLGKPDGAFFKTDGEGFSDVDAVPAAAAPDAVVKDGPAGSSAVFPASASEVPEQSDAPRREVDCPAEAGDTASPHPRD